MTITVDSKASDTVWEEIRGDTKPGESEAAERKKEP